MNKQCSKCHRTLDISFFWAKNTSKDGLDVYCKVCRKEAQNKWLARNKDRRKKARRRYYLKNKETLRDRRRKREKQYPERTKQQRKRYAWRYKLKKLYGISEKDYGKMVLGQLGKCAICGTSSKDLVIDHNHRTGKARSLLCNECNIHLGYYERDKAFHKKAAKYLKKTEALTCRAE